MKKLIATAALIASTILSAKAVEVPDTPAGHYLAMWVDGMNSADLAKLDAYSKAVGSKSTAQDWLDLRKVTGDLSVLKIEKNDPDDIVAVVGMSLMDDAFRAEYRVDPKDPKKILFKQIAGTDRPADLAIPRLSQADALSAFNARLDKAVAQDEFMGVAVVEDHGHIVLEKAWGYGDREKKTPLKLTGKFRLGSMNKMFTATATLQLVGQGKLSLDGTVGQYLPDYPNKEIAAKVTIRMLLIHAGGTGEIFGDEFDKHRLELKTLDDYVKLYGARGPEFPPGSQTDYSNYGFILLGVIVGKVSGEDYYDYVRKHIFEPAGMTGTASLPESVDVPGRVTGYMKKDGKWVPATGTLPWRGTSAGGGYSTLADLLRFAHAMMDGKLLPDDLRDAASRSETKGDWYGYGFEIHDTGLAHNYGHTGGAPGMATEMRIYPEAKTVVISLSNVDPGLAVASYYANRMPLRR
jgi:CubicO group peptidase (beta-lactamase class C family)